MYLKLNTVAYYILYYIYCAQKIRVKNTDKSMF